MVNHGGQDVFVVREFEQIHPQRDFPGDVEALAQSADNQVGSLFGRNHRVTEGYVGISENGLIGPSCVFGEDGSQGFVTKKDVRQRFSQS
ncbi:hypothetical protein BKP42_20660 [Rhodococcus erythropolis]|nr:hypothetical protein BKP42_20660 [Rhodococcus erythropolis]